LEQTDTLELAHAGETGIELSEVVQEFEIKSQVDTYPHLFNCRTKRKDISSIPEDAF